MTDTYKSLNDSLLRTKTPLIEACKDLNLDIDKLDFNKLTVTGCDNCFYWHKTKNMTDDGYGLYCSSCIKSRTMII
jgi:hypothetical protein